MVIYLVNFILSCMFVKIAENRKTNKWKILFSIIAITIPCLIAGFRASSIGTDIKVYVLPLHNLAMQSNSFSEYLSLRWYRVWEYVYVKDFEIGFNMLVYFSTKIFNSLSGVLFILQMFVVCPIYIALFKLRDHKPVWLGMLVFYFTTYNITLNLMRQSIAVAFLFLGFYYLVNKDNSKIYFFWLFIAALFHYSALIGLIIYIVYRYIERNFSATRIRAGRLTISTELFKIMLTTFMGIIILLTYNYLTPILNAVGLQKYIAYIDGDLAFLSNQLILRLPIIILFLFNWKNLVNKERNIYFYFLMVILDLLFSQFSSITDQSGRIGMYFSMFIIYSLPSIVNSYRQLSNKIAMLSIVILYVTSTWFYDYVIQGRTETVPYMFNSTINFLGGN